VVVPEEGDDKLARTRPPDVPVSGAVFFGWNARRKARVASVFGSNDPADCLAAERSSPVRYAPGRVPLFCIRGAILANDWEDMTADDKVDHLLSRLDTLERRLEEVLGHLSDLSDAVEAIELKLRQ
jgi:hypothetical protein